MIRADTPLVQDLLTRAPGLTLDADGTWRGQTRSAIDYPDDANAFCFGVEERSFWFDYRNRFIVEVLRRFRPSGPVADIGAGNGFVSLALQRAGFPTIVIEPGACGARHARARGLEPVVCATVQEAGFLPASLEAAGLFDVLEHIEDDNGFLRTLHTLLRPGGRLYLTVPAFAALWSSEDELVGHHRRYRLRPLANQLHAAGFSVDYATYVFAPLILPLFLLRTLPSRLGRRRTLDADRTKAELEPPSQAVVKAVTTLLDGEVAVVKRGRRIPAGTSCLIAASARQPVSV
jgi:SAM-dependent methyltransferase